MNTEKNFRTCAIPVRLNVSHTSVSRNPHNDPETAVNLLAQILLSLLIAFTSVSVFARNRIALNVPEAKNTVNKNIYGHFAKHFNRCIYGSFYTGEGSKKIPNKDGVRLDAVEALKAVKSPVLRRPGGCFANNCSWIDAVVPKGRRKPVENVSWDNVREDKGFGTAGFLVTGNTQDVLIDPAKRKTATATGRILRSDKLQKYYAFHRPQKIKSETSTGAGSNGNEQKVKLPLFFRDVAGTTATVKTLAYLPPLLLLPLLPAV